MASRKPLVLISGKVAELPSGDTVDFGTSLYDEVFTAGTDFTAGTSTTVTLARNYSNEVNITVHFDAAFQGPDTYSLSGTTLTFDAAIPSDVLKVYLKSATTASAAPLADVAAATHAATSKATPVDADEIPIADSAASWVIKKLTWANLKATLKAYFDTLYVVSHLYGNILSTAGSSTTITIGAGRCSDSTVAVNMIAASAINKTTSAWAVGSGNGGLDTGTIANNQTYHIFRIYRSDTGVIDGLLSLSPTAPTLPANYTHFRRVGSRRTNGSGQWTSFIQDGDYFQELAPSLDVNSTNPGTSAVTRTLTSVPTGINVRAVLNVDVTIGSTGVQLYLSDLAVNDDAPSATAAPLGQIAASIANGLFFAQVVVRTNTSAQIRSRLNNADAGIVLRIAPIGYYDTRGRDA